MTTPAEQASELEKQQLSQFQKECEKQLQTIRQILTSKQELKQRAFGLFDSVDKDGDQFVQIEEFEVFMRAIALHAGVPVPNSDEIQTAFEYFDKDGNGLITKDEFVIIFKKLLEEQQVLLSK